MGTEGDLLRVALHQFGHDVVLSLKGEVNSTTAPFLEREFNRALTLVGDGRLVIDMSGVEFLGSIGIGSVIRGEERAKSRGVSVVVQNPRPIDRKLFDVLQLPVVDTSPSASTPRAVPSKWERSPWQRSLWDPDPAGWASSRAIWPS
jgi:anti-sigma B factor antagonist